MSKKINWGTNDEFIAKYKELKSSRKMGEFYHCDKSSVLNHAKSIGYDVNSNKTYKLSEQDKKEIIEAYNEKTSTELALKYNVSRGMITKLWYDNNLNGKETKITKTTEIDLSNQIFGKWTVLYKSKKRSANGSIYWHCKCECGREKDVLGASLKNHRSLSCGNHNNISRGNVKISKLLDEYDIPYELEKKFSTCIDQRYLPFDFYVSNKYLIEFDGEQHHNQNSKFDYEYTHKHDLIKSQWCKDNNIPLIRIPYTHYDNLCIEDLLLETSQFIE
jgi:hypothetical protein